MSVNGVRELKATELELVSGGFESLAVPVAILVAAILAPTPINTDSAKEYLASKQGH
jgi:hypothetical protein